MGTQATAEVPVAETMEAELKVKAAQQVALLVVGTKEDPRAVIAAAENAVD